MKTKTCIYNNNELVRQEKICTLLEYVEIGRLKPGQCILIGDITSDQLNEFHTNTESFYVGDCTPYIQPTTNDGIIGRNYKNDRMKKICFGSSYPFYNLE